MEIVAANPVLAVHDLQASAEWYRQVLACEVAEVDPGIRVFCRSGSIQIMLGRCPDTPLPPRLAITATWPASKSTTSRPTTPAPKTPGAEVSKELRREPWGREEFPPDGHRFVVAGRRPAP